MSRFIPEGRFETIAKPKARNKSLNDQLRNTRSEPHEPKHSDSQNRSRLKKHFRHAIHDWIDQGDDYCDSLRGSFHD